MADWPFDKVLAYCKTKSWFLETLNEPAREAREHFPENNSYTDESRNINASQENSNMNDYSNIFTGIAKAKPMGGGFAPRLGLGSHRLALKSYKVKDSTKGNGQFLEAEFLVIKSTTVPAGETRSWVWFINAGGPFAGAYEQDRAKKFLEAVGACVGDDSPVEVIGANLAGPNQAGKGLVIEVDIIPQGGKGAGKVNQRGEPYSNSFWKPVAQTLEDLAASRAEIEAFELAKPAPAPQETYQGHGGSGMGQATTAAPAPRKGLGLLGGR